jgi:hypothetical protein
MNTQNKDGGPAFPIAFRMNDKQVILEDGISVRDYFAGKALQGICASSPSDDCTDEYIAAESYRLANAMLKARETSK